jgi:hypothetical protein
MRGLNAAEPQFPDDDGAVDPAVHAALTAYAAGQCGEYSALTALSRSRLLVPVVAVLTEAAESAGLRREKSAEMALPTLIGRDGRPAIIAFTSLDALARWRPDARPVPVPAARVWLAGMQDASAVVIDVAGPVPVAVDGARLAALAAGRPVPMPHQDPDVLAALHAVLAQEPLIVQAALTSPDQRITGGIDLGAGGPGAAASDQDGADLPIADLDAADLDRADPDRADPDGAGQDTGRASADLALEVTLAEGCDPARAAAAVQRTADALLAATAGRLRRGVEVSVIQPGRAVRRA